VSRDETPAEKRAMGGVFGCAFFGMLAAIVWPQHLEWIAPATIGSSTVLAGFCHRQITVGGVLASLLVVALAFAPVLHIAEMRASEAAAAAAVQEFCPPPALTRSNADSRDECEQIARDIAGRMREAGYAPPSWYESPEF